MIRRDPSASFAINLGLVAALLALCLRLMAPTGWMPVSSASGVIFTLCSGSGAQQVSIGKHGAPATPESGAEHAPCAFNSIGTPALPDMPPAVALQIFLLFIALGLAATPRPQLATTSWLWPPLRGPPPSI